MASEANDSGFDDKSGVTTSQQVRKVRKREPEKVRSQVLKAALKVFAEHGYEGTTIRGVANEAGVEATLLLYHFKSKDQLWHATVADVLASYSIKVGKEFARLRTEPAAHVLRAIIAKMVRHYAETPELHRIMTELGHQDNARLEWAMDQFVKPQFEKLCAVIRAGQEQGAVRQIAPERLRYAIVAMAAVPFTIPHEYERLVGRKFNLEDEIEATTDLINAMVFIS